MERLTRAEKRNLRDQKRQEARDCKNRISLRTITPKTKNQENVFRDFTNGKNLLIHGLPGTGKTFISLYLALTEIQEYHEYHNITIIRSVVPTRDMGFLPGSVKDKAKVYEAPYQAICTELYGRKDAYDILKNNGVINFETSSFLRGITFDNTIIIVDECQNMSYHELSTIITRVGKNTRIIFCGDYRQTDLVYDDDKTGLKNFMKIINKMPKYFSCIEFIEDDIVRSGLVKEFIIKKIQLETNNFRSSTFPSSSHFAGAEALHSPQKE